MRKLLLQSSRVLARAGLWLLTVRVLVLAGPLHRLDEVARGRLMYAFLMSRGAPGARSLYAHLLRREMNRSVQTNLWLAAVAQQFERNRLAAIIYRHTAKQAQTPRELVTASAMLELTDAIVCGTIYAMVAGFVDGLNLAQGEDVLLITVGKTYLNLFALWLEQARRHKGGSIVALVLDATSLQATGATLDGRVIDLSRFFVFDDNGIIHDRSRNALWILRVLVIRELVSRGHRLLSIDLDAVMLANVDDMLRQLPEADIVIQEDYSIPMDVARRLGFVLCCGFMVVQPTAAAKAFLDRYATRTMGELDDQSAINHMIVEAGVTELAKTETFMTFRSDGVVWVCPAKSIVSRDLRYGTVVRHFKQHGHTVAELRAELGLTS